jgi:HSP20 family protein
MFSPSYTRRRDPFALMRSMLRDLDVSSPNHRGQEVFPAINVWQNDDAVAITAELPGVEPAELEISLKENALVLSGERKAPEAPQSAHWHRTERRYGKFTRAVRLPFTPSDDKVEARLSNGVLRIVIGRPDEDKPTKIEIKSA